MTGEGADPAEHQRVAARSLFDALGGGRALVDSAAPSLVFVPVYALAGLMPAVWGTVGAGALLIVVRLIRRQTVTNAIAGFVVAAIAAFLASRTGQGVDFFLPKLLIDGGYGAVYLISILVGWPIIGVVLGPLLGEWFAWRREPRRLRAYMVASLVWLGMFVARLLVQVPLYLSGNVVALGVAHVVMSWPLWLVVIWLTWLILRRVPLAQPAQNVESAAGSDDAAPDPAADSTSG